MADDATPTRPEVAGTAGDGGDLSKFVEKAKNKRSKFKLMGFGVQGFVEDLPEASGSCLFLKKL